ncbi:MAG: tryptophan synthase subunit alpha [Spirochaetota bacterium]
MYRGIYLCLGYPDLKASLEALAILKDHPNIDFIELGLPFSDPVADGPVISAAAQDALLKAKEHGISPLMMLEQAVSALRGSAKDVFLMTYGNMIYHLRRHYQGFEQLALRGLIIPDLPLPERDFFKGLGFPVVPFATTESTAEDFNALGETQAPFIYFVAIRGITGTQTDLSSPKLRRQYAKVCELADCPVVLGFGIQGPEQIHALADFANGFVIGTAAVKRQGDPSEYRRFLDSLS